MADPLRRTLLAKLRGRRSKKGATVGGGYCSAAAAEANGGREGKEKVLQTQLHYDEARPVMLFSSLDCTAERMSTYENCVDGTAVHTGGVIVVRESRAAELAGARFQERSSGGRVGVNEEPPGVSLQRDAQHEGRDFREVDGSHQGPGSAHGGEASQLQRRHFVSVPRQRSAGDSIGFGDNSNHVLHRAKVESHTGVYTPSQCRAVTADSDGPEPRSGAQSRHMAAAVVAVGERNACWSLDDGAVARPHVSTNLDGHILNGNFESRGPEFAGGLHSPTFFPTELEICDNSLCAAEGSLAFPVDSEDEDYYDNEILPFYGTIREKSDGDRAGGEELTLPAEDKGQLGDSGSAQETHRLRNQLKEAYYLLINAMNDISLDVQQIDSGLTEQQAASSCSSHSRDSLCSRLSAKNMDSVSWSSGGDHSPQQVSDTDSLLLCHSGNVNSGLSRRLNSKSMLNLSFSKIRPTLSRSASDGAIRYPDGAWISTQGPREQSPEICEDKEAPGPRDAAEAVVRGAGELASQSGITRYKSLKDAGGKEDGGGQLNDSSGSVNSLTGSSDSNADCSSGQRHGNKQGPAGVRAHRFNSVNKGHGVTVNKMQEWMHKGRLLSSEMKQRIEGSSPPCAKGQRQETCCSQGNSGGSKPGVRTSSRGAKASKSKSPTAKTRREQQQPGRSLSSRGSPEIRALSSFFLPSDYCHPPRTVVNSVWPSTLHSSSSGCKARGRDTSDLLLSFLRLSNWWRVLSFTLI